MLRAEVCWRQQEKRRDGLVYVDLDGTLINSVGRYEDEIGIAARFGVAEDLYKKCLGELFSRHGNCYKPALLMSILRERVPGFPETFLDELTALLNRRCIFADALPFLKAFCPEHLVLLTSGDPETQWVKIRANELEPYFCEVQIADKKTSAIRPSDSSPQFFIDDAPREIEAMKRARPWIVCIQVRKPPPWETQKYTTLDDFYFSSLAGLAKFIKEYRP